MLQAKAERDDAHTYTFSGTVEGVAADEASVLHTGIARALSAAHLIDTFAGWGLTVTAVTAFEEVSEAIEVLEAIRVGSDEVHATDFVNFMGSQAPYGPNHVFTYLGTASSVGSVTHAGFAVAESERDLVAELARLKFNVHQSLSLTQAQELIRRMHAVSDGDAGFFNLLEFAAAA